MAVDQKVSKYMREHGPATDWHLRAEGAENALRSLTAAIEAEGYEVLMSACDATYSVRPRDDYHVSEPEYAEASPAAQKAMRHFWRQAVACSSDAIMNLRAENERLRACFHTIAAADDDTTAAAFKSVAYDAVMNLIPSSVAEHQLVRRSHPEKPV